MAKDKGVEAKTHVITAAQGIQSPYSARAYGRDTDAGKPNKALIRTIEDYVERNNADLQICAIAGSYVNEIELDPFFHGRDDVFMHDKAIKRNEQNKVKEANRREAFGEQQTKRAEKAASRAESRQTDLDNPEFLQMLGMPMHYFWDDIPQTSYRITGENLNSNLRVVGTQSAPQNKDPLSGKQSLLKKFNGRSLILPATKQRLKSFASGQAGKYPKLQITTGACTYPSYNDTNQRGEEAESMHAYGFVVADILSDKVFIPRVVPAQKNGTFIDLGIKYSAGKKPEKVATDAMVVADSHVAEINPKVDRANREQMKWFQPRYTHFNDIFDALSINGHNLEDSLLIDELHAQGLDVLEREAVLTAEYIRDHAEIAREFGGEVFINFSNHDDMLYRWLTKFEWKKDKVNRRFASKLYAQDPSKDNALRGMMKYVMPDMPDNVTFLKRGEDRIYWGFQCAAHGHLGKNGSRGSMKSLVEGYTKVVKGHTHEFEISDDSIGVGTSAMIPMPYQLGQPISSMAANAVIYRGGLSQGIPVVKGKWSKERFADVLD
ncbi:hypothetical protein HN747_01860 [archaeon]|jgi:hypothetical protein|nr:hypothetical protein [archaeon]